MEDFEYFYINYGLDSYLGELEGNRFVNHFTCTITRMDDETNKEIIGEADVKIFLLGSAMNEGVSAFDLFDNPEFGWDNGFKIYDVEGEDFSEEIETFYEGITEHDICFIDFIQLIPKYRGQGIGKKIIKDIFLRFSGACGLFIVDIYPMQFANLSDEERKLYGYDRLDENEEKANDTLHAYFLQLGFDKILDNTLRFIYPGNRNTLFSSIILE